MIMKKKWTPKGSSAFKILFEGENQQEIGKWTEYLKKKENGPRASSAPALGLNTIIFKYVYWYMKQISGERLQDHWSSGVFFSNTTDANPRQFPYTEGTKRR